jgi:hypothetical protein
MKPITTTVIVLLLCGTSLAAKTDRSDNAHDSAVLQADSGFEKALASGDKAQLEAMLDNDFTWTDSQGKTESRAQFLEHPSASATNDQVKSHTYGDVALVTASRDRVQAVRVWVHSQSSWKLLADQETTLAEKATPPKNDSTECENPCKTLPYTPKNEAERDIIASWQELETAVTHHDAQGWAPHVADEFMLVNNNNDHVFTKADRMAILDKQKQNGSPSAPVPLVSAKMFDYGETVVMKAEHQRATGKAIHVTRIWIKRDGKWIMAFSQQTTVQ